MQRQTAVLDTGAGSSFIRKSELPPEIIKRIQNAPSMVKVRDANNRALSIVGRIRLDHGTHSFVEVRTDKHGLITVEPTPRLLEDQTCITGTGVAQLSPEKTFKGLVGNFGDKPKTLLKNQFIAHARPHPTFIKESGISQAELLSIATEDTPRGDS